MNLKALNMKKGGVKRIWIVGSVFIFFVSSEFLGSGNRWLTKLFTSAISLSVWWALLYVSFWVARGFVDDNNKKNRFLIMDTIYWIGFMVAGFLRSLSFFHCSLSNSISTK